MAQRPYFISTNDDSFFREETCEFEYFNGFAITQKQKSIESLHEAILKKYPSAKILEVSRKSPRTIGEKLSAFNLILTSKKNGQKYPIENIFQSSKVFANGGPYKDLLFCSPIEAKKDERLRNSGQLISFNFEGKEWDLEPRSFFYDYIYIRALLENDQLIKELIQYDTFTDIEFNPKKSINCQARSVAIFVSLYKSKRIQEYMNNTEQFKTLYKKDPFMLF